MVSIYYTSTYLFTYLPTHSFYFFYVSSFLFFLNIFFYPHKNIKAGKLNETDAVCPFMKMLVPRRDVISFGIAL